jgi:hypothetical protein
MDSPSMSRYSIRMVIRATGDRRLPKEPFEVGHLKVEPKEDGSAKVIVEPIEALNAQGAFDRALALVTRFAEYLALLGSDTGFLTTGLGDVGGRNLDFWDSPRPPGEPLPLFDCIGGIITHEGQEAMGGLIDPDGSKRRSGFVVVHHLTPVITPGAERFAEVLRLWERNLALPRRLQTAMGILHDAACAREPSNAFAQTYTALEVLTESVPTRTAIDAAIAENILLQSSVVTRKTALRKALSSLLEQHNISGEWARRMIEHAMNAHSASQVDIAVDYFKRVGFSVDRNDMKKWRALRGALVHAAADRENTTETIDAFRRVVTSAVLAELRALDATQSASLMYERK